MLEDSERRGCEADRVSVGVVAGIAVVEQVIVTGLAIRVDRRRQGLQIADDFRRTWLPRSAAIAVAPAPRAARSALTVRGVPIVGSRLRIGIFDFM